MRFCVVYGNTYGVGMQAGWQRFADLVLQQSVDFFRIRDRLQ